MEKRDPVRLVLLVGDGDLQEGPTDCGTWYNYAGAKGRIILRLLVDKE